MIVEYTYCGWAGIVHRVRAEGVASWADEPYPPGGFIRVARDINGRALVSPHLDELIEWKCEPSASA